MATDSAGSPSTSTKVGSHRRHHHHRGGWGRGTIPSHSRCPHLPPSCSVPRLVIRVCLHFQRNQYNLIPIDFYWWKIWFSTLGNLYLYVSAHTCLHLSFSSLPSCHLLSDDKCSITVNLYMIPLLYQESFMPPLPFSTHFEQRECSIVVYIAVHFYNSKDIHSTLCLISVFWFVLYFVLYISVNKMWPYIVYSPQYRHLAILPIY